MRTFFSDLLCAPAPGGVLEYELAKGSLGEFPHLDKAPLIPAGPRAFHSGSVLAHMARCMNTLAGDPLAVWLAFAHDAGKLTTSAEIWPHHYGHEERGEEIAAIWAEVACLPPEYREAGMFTAREHMRAGKYMKLRPGKKLRLLKDIFAEPYASQFLRLVDTDSRSNVSCTIIKHWQKIRTWQHLPEQDQIQMLAGFIRQQPGLF